MPWDARVSARRWWAWCVLALLSLVVPGTLQAASQREPLTIGLAQLNSRDVPVWIAQEQGFFARHGVDASVVLFRGGTQAMQALIAGQVSVLVAAAAEALSAAAQGVDVVEIATVGPKLPYSLVVRPEVQRVEDLRGRAVAVSGGGLSASRLGVIVALRYFGVDPARDGIALVPIGSPSERLAALLAGNVYAAVLDTVPYGRLAGQRGLRVLYDFSETDVPWVQTALHTTRRFLNANETKVEAVLKAMLEAYAFIHDQRNKAAVLDVIAKNLQLEPQEAEETYTDLLRSVPRKPYPNREGLKAVVDAGADVLPDLARVDLEQFVDTRLLEQLDRSGFIDALYRSSGP